MDLFEHLNIFPSNSFHLRWENVFVDFVGGVLEIQDVFICFGIVVWVSVFEGQQSFVSFFLPHSPGLAYPVCLSHPHLILGGPHAGILYYLCIAEALAFCVGIRNSKCRARLQPNRLAPDSQAWSLPKALTQGGGWQETFVGPFQWAEKRISFGAQPCVSLLFSFTTFWITDTFRAEWVHQSMKPTYHHGGNWGHPFATLI